jgi:hypothetical protein
LGSCAFNCLSEFSFDRLVLDVHYVSWPTLLKFSNNSFFCGCVSDLSLISYLTSLMNNPLRNNKTAEVTNPLHLLN